MGLSFRRFDDGGHSASTDCEQAGFIFAEVIPEGAVEEALCPMVQVRDRDAAVALCMVLMATVAFPLRPCQDVYLSSSWQGFLFAAG